jgi:bis(5'-nucleosyl)-tetraphosphatase (symmetrical)
MAKYVIGDIQGCYTQLMQLLSKLEFNRGQDTIYLIGDLVNRGPQSLEVLQWAYDNQDSVVTILGNHDIYLLARYANIRGLSEGDTLNDILISKYAPLLIDWLRSCPLIYQDSQYLLAHAGIYPKMDLNQLLLLSHQISQQLQSTNYAQFIDDIYGNKPNKWSADLSHIKQMKFAINACTRMRYLELPSYELNYSYKRGDITKRPDSLIPWFEVDFHSTINKTVIFGHWAALGLFMHAKCICLDSGCVWGGKLSALNLDSLEVIQV